MSDKRKVSTDALETLGNIIDDTAARDAIHLAVEPVIAGEQLLPRANIGIENGLATTKTSKKVGIVDPFLKKSVATGERFWLVIYPRQITSLRHVWSHPDFEEEVPKVYIESEIWVREFAEKLGISYDRLMDGADDYVTTGDYLHMGNNEEYLNYYHQMDEFWEHYNKIRGGNTESSGSFFTCSC